MVVTVALFQVPDFMASRAAAQEPGGSNAITAVGSTLPTCSVKPDAPGEFRFFEFYYSDKFSNGERYALFAVIFIALSGLLYAWFLMRQVYAADTGTAKMQAVADAVREGAVAYLKRQLMIVGFLIILLVILLFLTKAMTSELGFYDPFAWGRAGSFLLGAIFSGTVGFVGMRLATIGNLRVAAAAQVGFGRALILGYRTGTVTGMLTDGLGLLGGTIIFMIFGEHAYEALLGFGFGGTLLALFMRVGGGIFTKAADVGADLVGKIEKDIPEDDPRNAATIADNVGDNVGDCAGMAADIFESYEVTIVAAMILGWVAFGHKGVMFPILVRSIGVMASIISTYLVRAGDQGGVGEAMDSINLGFYAGSVLSVLGFILLGGFYLYFGPDPSRPWLTQVPYWANFNMVSPIGWVLDMRPAYTCLIGIILCVALNRCTEYFTGTEFTPVKQLVKNCTTGHATNIIEGMALGFESAVVTAIILSIAIFSSVIVYSGTNAICIAYGVAMCGIGMLTMTGNTISMDVFGPVADNANGIGEMGYDEKEMGPENYKRARQVLSDLDAVGNTTKAVTKGVAIGSAVIAAVSLYASFITVVGSGGGGESAAIPIAMFDKVAGLMSISDPRLLIGMLLGGSVPMLFSSMTIRAVGRAAFLIVHECRAQFRRPGVMEGTVKPEYGRVVAICTAAAQKELVGPAFLAVFAPVLVGFLLGPIALAGFLGGAIVVGQLMASFMCNAGGAWDNCKKTIEDAPRNIEQNRGKGSEMHKASVTGDTVGDPLKDTAGPAINPLLKVMNMVSILAVPLLIGYDRRIVDAVKKFAIEEHYNLNVTFGFKEHDGFYFLVVFVSTIALLWSYWQSRREVKRDAMMVDIPQHR
ncbi:MAG: sodium-translocating pyrophosphatase [Candidatus Riflebacteria bacterium]|nr:sodium-translocating pyrophosphatase [Candidatus Riflebacteria bacterium]